jgi:hypothetical protein
VHKPCVAALRHDSEPEIAACPYRASDVGCRPGPDDGKGCASCIAVPVSQVAIHVCCVSEDKVVAEYRRQALEYLGHEEPSCLKNACLINLP